MMIINKLTFKSPGFPEMLRQIPSAPQQLYHTGAPLSELLQRPRVAIVGSRGMTPYGRQVTSNLAGQLAEKGIVIISGLAFGVDATAHQAALAVDGLCIAVLPSPLDNIVPISNRGLAQQILDHGGALVSEYASGEVPFKQNFITRNRLMSGLAQVLLITEATEKSGALHTARFAREQNKDVLIVPGNITAASSAGTNNLLKSGAGVVTSYIDILHNLGLKDQNAGGRKVRGRNAHEQTVLDLMLKGLSDAEELLEQSRLDASQFNQVITMLEISDKIRPLGANHWGIA